MAKYGGTFDDTPEATVYGPVASESPEEARQTAELYVRALARGTDQSLTLSPVLAVVVLSASPRARGAWRLRGSVPKTRTQSSHRASCEFSGVQTRLTLAIAEAKGGTRVWCRQHKTQHAEAACRMACA
jgi:hypothetical protein